MVRASPFKTKPQDKGVATAVDIRRIMEQNNYTNMFLRTIGDQLNKFEEIIETQDHIKNSFVKNDNKPLFKPFEFSKKFQENPHIDQAFIDRISQKVKDSIIIPKKPQPFAIPDTPLLSHQRINLVKNISFDTKVDELIKITKEHVLDTLTIKDLQEKIRQYK